jgi:hypothetical protein
MDPHLVVLVVTKTNFVTSFTQFHLVAGALLLAIYSKNSLLKIKSDKIKCFFEIFNS